MTRFGILVLAILTTCNPAFASDLLPVEAFAEKPSVKGVELSLDGRNVVALINVDRPDAKGTAVNVLNLETAAPTTVLYGPSSDYDIVDVVWANNDVLLVITRFLSSRRGLGTAEWRSFTVDIHTKEVEPLLRRGFLRRQNFMPFDQANIIDMLPDDDEKILIGAGYKLPTYPTVAEVTLKSKKVREVEPAIEGIWDWVTDRQHRVRIGLAGKDAKNKILHRPVGGKKWLELWAFESFGEEQVWPIGFDADPNILYVNAYHEGRLAVFSVDVTDPALAMELVASDPVYDVEGSLVYSQLRDEVVGLQGRTGELEFWDPAFEELQMAVDEALPGTTNFIYSLSADERKYVVLATSDIEPGTYFIGDRDKNEIAEFASRYPMLASARLSHKKRIRYAARDGVEIEGFLTVPRGHDAGALPAIVFPHGGPQSFSWHGFDSWTQFLVNRGFAVLQMNFRGSEGYGYDFAKVGGRAWGREMQTDVEDGTRWLIEEGIANPGRICVVGASYGGYATLMEAARNSDLYRCAVSFAGVADLPYLLSTMRKYYNDEYLKKYWGEGELDLESRSPRHLAGGIDIPVLLVHGSEDRRVRVQHSRRMHEELEKLGKDVNYIELEGGDHLLTQQNNRLRFFRALDEFLRLHLQQ